MKYTIRSGYTIIGSAALLSAGLAASAEAQALKVGMTQPVPFGLDGFCGELMPLIAERAGLQLELVGLGASVGLLFPALVNNEVQVLCAPTGANGANRQLGVAFTGPIFMTPEAMMVLATDTTPYTDWADFRGQAVGTNQGVAAYTTALTEAGVTDVRPYANDAAAIAALIAGEVKAVMVAGPSNRYRQQVQGMYPETRMVEDYVPGVIGVAAIAVRDTDVELLGQLQAAVEGLKADGTIADLTTEWLLPSPPDL